MCVLLNLFACHAHATGAVLLLLLNRNTYPQLGDALEPGVQ
jgi:hypothetical protein